MVGLKLEQHFLSKLNEIQKNDFETMYDEPFIYQSVFLSLIVPDVTNPRFLPIISIEDHDAKLFISRKITKNQLVKMYDAENHILLGKGCIINCLKYGSTDWKEANKSIESIIELGTNIGVSELIQVATIYPISSSEFQILTGHRRYFALIYANGYGSAAQFKIYKSKPLLTKVKQFQENASREDLPQYGKLAAFKDAILEIELLNDAKLKLGFKKLTVKKIATSLGISMGTYDNYYVLSRYISVMEAYKSGMSLSFIRAKKIVLDIESEYKKKNSKLVLNFTDRDNINSLIKSSLFSGRKPNKIIDELKFKIEPISSSNTIKRLLTTNIMELDCGVDWDSIDWDDHRSVLDTMTTVIKYLENTTEQ